MIALVAQCALDRTRWPDGSLEQRLGGPPIFAARAVAGFHPAVVVTCGGTDELRRPLHETGLEVVAAPGRGTTVFDVHLFGDGGWTESIAHLGSPFLPADVTGWMRPALERCSTAVCGTQWRGDFPAASLEELAGGGRRVFLDGQGMARPRRLGPILLEGPLDRDSLAFVDVLKLGEQEAIALIGRIDADAARQTGVPVVVVTLGERGAVMFRQGQTIHIPVRPVRGLTDTVGAGDAFLALMAAGVDGGADLIEAARQACDGVARMLCARREAAIASAV